MAISNIPNRKMNEYIIDRDAEKNYDNYKKAMTTFSQLVSNEKLLTNIDSMESKLIKLKSNGLIDENSYQYDQLNSVLQQALDIHKKPNRSIEDTISFYDNYNNFIDLVKRVGG